MRLVWVVIPLILIVSMIGIVGIQESEATVCFREMHSEIEGSDLVFVGTAISSESAYYDDPLIYIDEDFPIRLSKAKEMFNGNLTGFPIKNSYMIHKFSVDEIIKGNYTEKEITIVVKLTDESIGKQYVPMLVEHDEGTFSLYDSGICGSSIYNISTLDEIRFYSLLQDNFVDNSNFLEILDINLVNRPQIQVPDRVFVGKIDDTLKPEFVFFKLDYNQETILSTSLKVDKNGFFSFSKLDKRLTLGDHELTVGVFDSKNPKIDKISFPLHDKTSYALNKEGEVCKNDNVPILKISDLSIKCVYSMSREKMMERNWGTWLLAESIANPPKSEPKPEPEPEPPTTPILLYSSKLVDDSSASSSTPLPPVPYDSEITISKIPKLGETATISLSLSLKPGFSEQFGNYGNPVGKFTLDKGFSFVDVETNALSFNSERDTKTFANSQAFDKSKAAIFQVKITPTEVGNWIVFVDGGYYNNFKNFNFVVSEDETILVDKFFKHESTIIPKWIKSNFMWWETGQDKDMTLDDTIKYLVRNGILDVNIENIPQEASPQFKQDIRDWHLGLMSDEDFLVILIDWIEN